MRRRGATARDTGTLQARRTSRQQARHLPRVLGDPLSVQLQPAARGRLGLGAAALLGGRGRGAPGLHADGGLPVLVGAAHKLQHKVLARRAPAYQRANLRRAAVLLGGQRPTEHAAIVRTRCCAFTSAWARVSMRRSAYCCTLSSTWTLRTMPVIACNVRRPALEDGDLWVLISSLCTRNRAGITSRPTLALPYKTLSVQRPTSRGFAHPRRLRTQN
jgi:hypothetical protein